MARLAFCRGTKMSQAKNIRGLKFSNLKTVVNLFVVKILGDAFLGNIFERYLDFTDIQRVWTFVCYLKSTVFLLRRASSSRRPLKIWSRSTSKESSILLEFENVGGSKKNQIKVFWFIDTQPVRKRRSSQKPWSSKLDIWAQNCPGPTQTGLRHIRFVVRAPPNPAKVWLHGTGVTE